LASAVAELGGGGGGAAAAELEIGVRAAAAMQPHAHAHTSHADESGNADYAQSNQRGFIRQLHCDGLGTECLGEKKVRDVCFYRGLSL
jgi:hypothetical protein